ncbi:NAD-dependent epimerase/dehydratase family protein [Mucilaginibacter ginkgonis]|nr:NAD-dependent epimerase/dehydratase family protein [Mucilaginibacter ginkgonis]
MRRAIIAGATGLVGSNLLQLLLHSIQYQEVIAVTRKEIAVQHPKLIQLIIDFDKLHEHAAAINGDVLFSCLGTTKTQAPDPEQYRKIEFKYTTLLADIAKNNGAQQLHYISSIGADISSSNFYLKLKGETESALAHLGLKSTHIYQPSVIKGGRKQSRPMEMFVIGLMKMVDPILIGSLKKYRSITAQTVAQAMFQQSLSTEAGLFIHPSDHIQNLA